MAKRTDLLLKDYFRGIKKLESAPTLSIISLVISMLFVSKVYQYFIINALYLVNVSFFALIAKDCWEKRKGNIIPLIAIVISILLVLTPAIDMLKVANMFS